jgi:1,4-dihydroxy-2-naphthoate octaprenyltransferase
MATGEIGLNKVNNPQERPNDIKLWLVGARTFALPATLAPVIFGTVAAVVLGGVEFRPLRFLLAALAMALLHTGANLLNDAVDFRKGLDVVPTPGSGAVVRGWITPAQALRASMLLLATGSLIGLGLVGQAGRDLFWIGLAGVALGVTYSVGPVWLKARALGDLAVLLAFGVLGALGAWTVQTGSAAWPVALWAVPIGLHVAGILHANNWRDLGHDRAGAVKTVAGFLGSRGSLGYYLALVWLPFFLVAGFVLAGYAGWLPALPFSALAVLIAAPEALRLSKIAVEHGGQPVEKFLALDAATARLNMVFGLLYAAGVGISALF